MTEPSVCAVLLTADRPEMTRKAVECFRAQTYANKRLLILDTGTSRGDAHVYMGPGGSRLDERLFWNPTAQLTIGQLRNVADGQTDSEIIIHLDSDDHSHANRFAEQVALLQSSGADVVGYREMLFWRANGLVRRELRMETVWDEFPQYGEPLPLGEAWLYSCPNPNYALDTSLCYRREVWERKPFEATSMGEDEKFLRGLKVQAHSSLPENETFHGMYKYGPCPSDGKPRMIARIHATNTSMAYEPRKMEAEARKSDGYWKRVPQWDAYCAETMK